MEESTGSPLLDMLMRFPKFLQYPLEKQEVIARLAETFEDNDMALYCTPQELQDKLLVGNRSQWQEFLNLEPVRQHIKVQLANVASVASRKAFHGLQQEAMTGDVQAAKQVNEMAGILNSGDRNKVIVLHRVNRRERT